MGRGGRRRGVTRGGRVGEGPSFFAIRGVSRVPLQRREAGVESELASREDRKR